MDQQTLLATDLSEAMYKSCEEVVGGDSTELLTPSSLASTSLGDSQSEAAGTASENEAVGSEDEVEDAVVQEDAVAQSPLAANPLETNFEFAPWVDGEFTTVTSLAKSMFGTVSYLESKDRTGVVAKIMPTKKLLEIHSGCVNERLAWFGGGDVNMENPWNEIAVLTFLQQSSNQCDYVLKLLGAFQDDASTYVLTEYCDGGELFECVACGDRLFTQQVRRYVSQLLSAVQHLHSHNVGHRDISLENILLRRGDCVLMDFGQAVRLTGNDGAELRYFAKSGKPLCRAPEMYVPRQRSIRVTCPPDASPGDVAQVSYDRCRCEVLLPADAVPGQSCSAEPHGYAVAPVDIFASGVCAFALAIGRPPWKVARDSDSSFSLIRQLGVVARLRQWNMSAEPELEALLEDMLRVSPKDRPTSMECLKTAWLANADVGLSEDGAGYTVTQ